MKPSKSLFLFAFTTLLICAAIAYFGYRTLTHEALLRHYQNQRLAQSHTSQVSSFIQGLLKQNAVHLSSVATYISLDSKALNQLIAQESSIDALFVLEKNRLLFPNTQAALTEKEKTWLQAISPIVQDPSLLYSHYFTDEQTRPTSGWYLSRELGDPLLIYWLQRGNQLIGFKFSYVKLLSDVINSLAFDYAPNTVRVTDDGRLLYQSGDSELAKGQMPLDSLRLPYPLSAWQIDYYAKMPNGYSIYLWGGLLILLLIALFGLAMLYLYREYTRQVRLAQQQVNFVGQVSHELKTPLTNISLYAEMLQELQQEESAPRSPNQRYLEVILNESQRLSRLIQNILSFTKAPKVHLQAVALSPVLNTIYRAFLPAFNARQMELVQLVHAEIHLTTDVDRLTQIISNFLSNAEKYAAHGKRVELIAEQRADRGLIRVRDYGSGIAAKDLKAIFQPFYRVKSSITEGVSGTGIGLTISKQLAIGLQGEISVTSGPTGSCFTLSLPLALEPQAIIDKELCK
ncbi:sensor histidine kinase [Serratia oryzae]|uniref:histidine kinase n=1 Tax=Serratia oryzae TaxID=2034155 RepID=A0A1S8CH94_9GAMM|nr:HAMP domain-containing sensor histidine kinase [Serratia oryzae]OMQ21712.1 two-component sensor histidine kinase [Serratia oryzae]VXC97279.1 Two-component sensor histidine kinase [Enterobacterales bacterium 8AC]